MSLKAKVEAIVYAAEEPVTLAQLGGILGEEILRGLEPALETQPELPLAEPDSTAPQSSPPEEPEPDEKKLARQRDRQVREALQRTLAELIADCANGERGMEIREIAGGYRMATKPEYHDAVRGFVKSLKPPLKLSLQALETLAVIAYKQPVTAPEVSEIRGVDTGGVLGGLISRKLITTAGRKQVIGRPILYKTTKEFLLRFGLKDLSDLPSMEEFEKMAGELARAETEAEDAAMRSSDPENSSGPETGHGPDEPATRDEEQDGLPDEDAAPPETSEMAAQENAEDERATSPATVPEG